YNRGNALSYLGRYEEAIASYDKAVEINPNYELYLKNRDRILQLLKEKSQESSDETQ
ncbi:MAG: tetratricopeptide repeat protein, partial [Spirulina sp.]